MSYQLGIDVGTTYTAAAVCRSAGRRWVEPEVVTLGTRGATVPSVLFIAPDGTVVVGEAAERRALTDPDRVVREFKRRIGDPTPIVVGGRAWAPEELSARLVRWVVDRVAEREGGPASQIALTHPASWGSHKKDLLTAALAAQGLRVSLLAEPQAAALHYATQERVTPGSTIAVYDLGGGTFDAAVVRKADRSEAAFGAAGFGLLGRPEGLDRLGGVDFDEVVFEHVRAGLPVAFTDLDDTDTGVLSAVARVRRECTEAKEALSADTDVSIPVLLPAGGGSVRLHRSEFESMIRPQVEETVDALRTAVRSAGCRPGELSAVLLVGGSSRIPLVAQLVSEGLARPVAVDTDPKNAIAKGAALSVSPVPTASWPEVAIPPVPAGVGRGGDGPVAGLGGAAGAIAAGAGMAAAGRTGRRGRGWCRSCGRHRGGGRDGRVRRGRAGRRRRRIPGRGRRPPRRPRGRCATHGAGRPRGRAHSRPAEPRARAACRAPRSHARRLGPCARACSPPIGRIDRRRGAAGRRRDRARRAAGAADDVVGVARDRHGVRCEQPRRHVITVRRSGGPGPGRRGIGRVGLGGGIGRAPGSGQPATLLGRRRGRAQQQPGAACGRPATLGAGSRPRRRRRPLAAAPAPPPPQRRPRHRRATPTTAPSAARPRRRGEHRQPRSAARARPAATPRSAPGGATHGGGHPRPGSSTLGRGPHGRLGHRQRARDRRNRGGVAHVLRARGPEITAAQATPRTVGPSLPARRTRPSPIDRPRAGHAGHVLIGLLIALVAMLLNSVGALLQASGAQRATRSRPAAVQPRYVGGMVVDLLAWLCAVAALRVLPVFAVQAVIGGSIAVTAVVGSRINNTVLDRTTRVAVAVCLVGLVLVAGSAGEGHPPVTSVLVNYVLIGALLVLGVLVLVLRQYRRAWPLAIVAGMGFGGTSLAVRAAHVEVGQGFSFMALLAQPAIYLIAGYWVVGMIGYSAALARGEVGW